MTPWFLSRIADRPLRRLPATGLALLASLVLGLCASAPAVLAAEAAATAVQTVAQLDAIGRAIAVARCQRPQEVKTRFLPSAQVADASDEMQSHACGGFRVAIYRFAGPGAPREVPMSVVVDSSHALLPAEWSTGARAAVIRSRLGEPQAATTQSLTYWLNPRQPGRDRLTFEVEDGIVRAVSWSWVVD